MTNMFGSRVTVNILSIIVFVKICNIVEVSAFKQSFEDFAKNEEKDLWNKFLEKLFSILSVFEIATSVIAGFRGSYTLTPDFQRIEIDHTNIDRFFNTLAFFYRAAENISVKNVANTTTHLSELNHVINLTLNPLLKKSSVHVECAKPYLFVKGTNILIDEKFPLGLIANLSITYTNKSCPNFRLADFKFLNIFALNTIFVTANLDVTPFVPNMSMITFIAPKWQSIGSNTINLDGTDGESHATSADDGDDGFAGFPGGQGGNFFGVVDECVNCADLSISVNGGTGGDGQNGGAGINGKDGETVPKSLYCETDLCYEGIVNGFKCESYYPRCHYLIFHNGWDCRLYFFGQDGQRGGDGGHGGRRGEGGRPGHINIIETNDVSGINVSAYTGPSGKNGKGGIGGIGGKRGNDLETYCFTHRFDHSQDISKALHECASDQRALPGKSGTDGESNKTVCKPENAVAVSDIHKAKILNYYKSYVRENMNDQYLNSSLLYFFNRLESDYHVTNTYNVLGLLDELGTLEQQFHTRDQNIDMLPFYQSLLQRASKYADGEKRSLHKYNSVVIYLQAVLLMCVQNQEDSFESTMISDVESYLDEMRTDINILQQPDNAKFKLDLIKKYNEIYRHGLATKLEETRDIISKLVILNADLTTNKLDSNTDTLLDELLQLHFVNQFSLLQDKQKQLRTKLAARSLLPSLDIVRNFVSLFNPLGIIIGIVNRISKTENGFYSKNAYYRSIENTLLSTEKMLNLMREFKDIKVRRFKEFLILLSKMLLAHHTKEGPLFSEVTQILHNLKNCNKNKIDFREVQLFESRLRSTIKHERKRNAKCQTCTTSKFHVLRYSETLLAMPDNILGFFMKHKYDERKGSLILEIINNFMIEFRELKDFEEAIYTTLCPVLDKIKNALKYLRNTFHPLTDVNLQVTGWEVQTALGILYFRFHRVIKLVAFTNTIMNCATHISRSMISLITLYDQIEDFIRSKNQLALTGNLSISTLNGIELDADYDLELQKQLTGAVHELDITLLYNILKQRYQVAINAFKGFVFPFANTYFKSLQLLPNFKLTSIKSNLSVSKLVYEATQEIGNIKLLLAQYRVQSDLHDNYIVSSPFHCRSNSTHPFYVWRNAENKYMISKLLSGQEVIVTADIKNGLADEDAIKFKTVEIYLKSTKEEGQSELDNIYKMYLVNMTHFGDSYYKYSNIIYIVSTASLNMWYSVAKNTSGEPYRSSASYTKLSYGYFMLSPYATWKIQIFKNEKSENETFTDLQNYINKVDVHLEGSGFFVRSSLATEQLMAEKCYKSIDI